MNETTEKAVKALVKTGVIHNEVDFMLRYGNGLTFPPAGYVYCAAKHTDGQGHKVRFCYSAHAWCNRYWSWKATVVKRTQLRITDVRIHTLRRDAEAYSQQRLDRWDAQYDD